MPTREIASGRPAAIGALVTLEEDGQRLVFFVAPHGGGATLAGGAVQVVTAKSPLGRAVLGKCAGDECEAQVAGRTRELLLLQVE
jgi:transcription elongation GreA/GreB family factor